MKSSFNLGEIVGQTGKHHLVTLEQYSYLCNKLPSFQNYFHLIIDLNEVDLPVHIKSAVEEDADSLLAGDALHQSIARVQDQFESNPIHSAYAPEIGRVYLEHLRTLFEKIQFHYQAELIGPERKRRAFEFIEAKFYSALKIQLSNREVEIDNRWAESSQWATWIKELKSSLLGSLHRKLS